MMELLDTVPPERWTERGYRGRTFLHSACQGDNVAAVVALLAHGLDVNAQTESGSTPAHFAILFGQPRVLETLCAAGASLRAEDRDGYSPVDEALLRLPRAADCLRILVSNGVRLRNVREDCRHLIPPQLQTLENGVLACRSAVVAFMRVKRVAHLPRWDKFLLAYIAQQVWITRCSKEWQSLSEASAALSCAML